MHKILVATTLVVGLMASTCGAQAAEGERLPRVFAEQVRPGVTREGFLAGVMAPFRAAVAEGDDLERRFDATHAVSYKETVRSEALALYMPYDRDGDGRITRDEVAVTARRSIEAHGGVAREPGFGLMLDEIMKADLDGDGFIDREELYDRAEVIAGDTLSTDLSGYLAITKEGESIDAAGILARAERAFSGIDADGDGVISQAEMAGLKG